MIARFLIAASALTLGHLTAAELHVWSESPNPLPPFTNQATAAHVLQAAVSIAEPGDTILVHPRPGNQAYEQVALYLTRSRITIRSAGSSGVPVPLSGRGFDYNGRGSTPRAIVQFNPDADDGVLEGFELFGAHNDSHNGAAVRINQANRVTVRRCVIHHNDMGIMSGGDGSPQAGVDQLIESCLIHSNGDRSEPGYNHNLYLGGTSVTLLGCEVHSSLTGHNVKSRAHRTAVLACYVHDSANREFDLVDVKGDTTAADSNAVLAGNLIVKAKNCAGNRGVIHFGQDGGNEHDGTLYLVHNTIVTPFLAAVVHLSASRARASLFNNVVWDGGTGQRGQVLMTSDPALKATSLAGDGNWLASGFAGTDFAALGLQRTSAVTDNPPLPWVKPDVGDYRLKTSFGGIIDAGNPLSKEVADVLGQPLPEFIPPQHWRARHDDGKPDLGAHELVVRSEPPR